MLDQLTDAECVGWLKSNILERVERANNLGQVFMIRGQHVVYHLQCGDQFGAGALVQEFAGQWQDRYQQGGRTASCADFSQFADVCGAQNVETTGNQHERTGRLEQEGLFDAQDFASCVHAGADSSHSSSATAAALSAVTAVMQR